MLGPFCPYKMATREVQIMRRLIRERQFVMGKQRARRGNNKKKKKREERKEVVDPWKYQLVRQAPGPTQINIVVGWNRRRRIKTSCLGSLMLQTTPWFPLWQ